MTDTFVIPKSIRKANYDEDGKITSSYETEDESEILAEVQRTWPVGYREAFVLASTRLRESEDRADRLQAIAEEYRKRLVESIATSGKLFAIAKEKDKEIFEMKSKGRTHGR